MSEATIKLGALGAAGGVGGGALFTTTGGGGGGGTTLVVVVVGTEVVPVSLDEFALLEVVVLAVDVTDAKMVVDVDDPDAEVGFETDPVISPCCGMVMSARCCSGSCCSLTHGSC